jgi:hypothetical protein
MFETNQFSDLRHGRILIKRWLDPGEHGHHDTIVGPVDVENRAFPMSSKRALEKGPSS